MKPAFVLRFGSLGCFTEFRFASADAMISSKSSSTELELIVMRRLGRGLCSDSLFRTMNDVLARGGAGSKSGFGGTGWWKMFYNFSFAFRSYLLIYIHHVV